MVPIEKLEAIERFARKRLLEILESRPGGLSEKEADRLANEAKHRTRPKRRK